MTEIKTPTGATVVINPASFKEANTLKIAVLREDGTGKFNINTIDTSDAVLAAIWPCLARCTYNANKITPDTFEKPETREDYYSVINACVVENLRPFMKGLISVSPLGDSLKGTNTPKPQ